MWRPVHVGSAGTGTNLYMCRAQVTGVFCNMAIESARADKESASFKVMVKHFSHIHVASGLCMQKRNVLCIAQHNQDFERLRTNLSDAPHVSVHARVSNVVLHGRVCSQLVPRQAT